jgi:hypothetical protein
MSGRSNQDNWDEMGGRDEEMGYNASGVDDDYGYEDRETSRGQRYSRYSDIDDVEGQYDEDYRDRDSYNYSRSGRGNGLRSSSGRR